MLFTNLLCLANRHSIASELWWLSMILRACTFSLEESVAASGGKLG